MPSLHNVLNVARENREKTRIRLFKSFIFDIQILLPKGSGPIPEVLQYRANPWGSRSKLLHLPPVPKISLISMSPRHVH